MSITGKNRLNVDGRALLQIEAYLHRRKIYFSTHIYLTPKQWNVKKRKIVNHPEAESLNYMLSDWICQLEHKELELWRKGVEVTLDALKREHGHKTEYDFLQFVNEQLEIVPSKESTRKNKKTTWKLLSQFKPHLDWGGITPSLIHDFESYLSRKGLGTNTVSKHLKHLSGFIRLAIGKGLMDETANPFRHYKIKTTTGRHSFLFPEELCRLEDLELTGHRLSMKHSLDAFLFCCYTGLRYSDFVALSEKNVVEIDGKPWLVFQTVKTGVEVKLPLHLLFEGKACRLLEKYRGRWLAFFALKSNALVNKELKAIGECAGIEKHFTFHSARHTNATLLVYQGTHITTVQKLLGHRSVLTTQGYSEVMGMTIVKDLGGK